MKRKIMNELIEWKNCTDKRMPLLLYGARQTGKTYVLRKFGETAYDNNIYINFERMTPVAEFFVGDLAPSRIIRLLEEFSGQKIHPTTTLLIFDEIQACERALTSLKYFCEEAPDIHVAAAGSLLGVVLSCDRLTRPELPLSAFRDLSAFKLYLSDVGLLSAFARIMPEDILRGTLSDTWRGAVAENYTAQAMKANGHTLYYWTNDSPQAEVNFVIQCGDSIVPVEVKSGERVRSRSLALFHKQYAPDRMIRLSEKNFGREDSLYAIPLYAAFCIGTQPL